MPTGTSPTQSKVKYSVDAQATNIFGFLKQTFFKMPRPVQVIGWLVFLLLFVFLVLHPILGITYFQGKVVSFKLDKDGKPVTYMERGLRVHKGSTTYTNEYGEFTLAVRVPNIPMLTVDFDFGESEHVEVVSLPGPLPFVSLFNPNAQKIYHVPGSRIHNRFGVAKRYFIDEGEASKAFKETVLVEHPVSKRDSVAVHNGLRQSGVAYAAEQRDTGLMYTLRLREIRITDPSYKTSEIYFEIRVDGTPIRLKNIPGADSRQVDRLTIPSGIPLRFQDMDVPLPKTLQRVEIVAFASRMFGNTAVGSVAFQLARDHVGKTFKEVGKNLELAFELLPAVAINYVSLPQGTRGYIAFLWLNISPQDLMTVGTVRYVVGSSGRVFAGPHIRRADYYSYSVHFYQPDRMTAEVVFLNGSVLKLTTYVEPDQREVKAPLDYYFMAGLQYRNNQPKEALKLVLKAIEGNPEFAPALGLKGMILSKLGRYEEAIAAYERALAIDPSDAGLLNGYAWIVADDISRPTAQQLLDARKRAEAAAKVVPDAGYYDTLGWVYFKSGEYPRALEALTRAKRIEEELGGMSSDWPEIHYHLGHVYLRLGRKAEATDAFQEVVKFGEKQGLFTKKLEKLDSDAKVQLKAIDKRQVPPPGP